MCAMKIGWDPIDELDGGSPVPAWAETVGVVLFVLTTLAMIYLST